MAAAGQNHPPQGENRQKSTCFAQVLFRVIEALLKELVEFALDIFVFLHLGLADKAAFRHDHPHVAESFEVVERVCIGDDKIGAFAGLDSAGNIIDMRYFGVSLRCGIKREFIRHAAVFAEIDKLSPHIVVGDEGAAGVGPQTDGNAVFKALPGAIDYALKYDLAVELRELGRMADGAIEQRIGKRGRNCRDKRRVRPSVLRSMDSA